MASVDGPLRNFGDWTPRRVVAATLTVVGVALAFVLVYLLQTPLFYLFIGIVLATALHWPIDWLIAHGVPRLAAVVYVYLIVLLSLVAILVIATPLLVEQGTELLGGEQGLPQAYQTLRTWMFRSGIPFVPLIAERLPPALPTGAEAASPVANWFNTLREALQYGGLVLHGVLALIFVVLMAFYWSLYDERTIRGLLLSIPAGRREEARELMQQMQGKVGAYIRGQGILCLAVGGMSLIAYLVIGLPYAFVLAFLAGVLEAVPLFGPVLGAIPPIAVALLVEPTSVLWVVLASVAIQQLENYVLVPRVMEGSVGVNPVVTLLAIAGFGALMGIAGAILAIPIAAIIQLLLDHFFIGPEALAPEVPQGRDAVSRLRYEAQQLVFDVRLKVRAKPIVSTERTDRLEEEIEAIAIDLEHLLAEREKLALQATADEGTSS